MIVNSLYEKMHYLLGVNYNCDECECKAKLQCEIRMVLCRHVLDLIRPVFWLMAKDWMIAIKYRLHVRQSVPSGMHLLQLRSLYLHLSVLLRVYYISVLLYYRRYTSAQAQA